MPEMLEQTKVSASKENVWQILMDFSSYKEWSKVITEVNFNDGLAVGKKGNYTFKTTETAYKNASVAIKSFDAGSAVGWGLKKGCLIEATRTLSVSDDGSGGCIFQHELTVHGCLSSVAPTTKAFALSKPFGSELKARAERQ